MALVNSMLDLVGNTPVVRLNRLVGGVAAEVFVKLENRNPVGSVKDRISLSMIEAAEKEGKISPERTTIVEPTLGNTGSAWLLWRPSRAIK